MGAHHSKNTTSSALNENKENKEIIQDLKPNKKTVQEYDYQSIINKYRYPYPKLLESSLYLNENNIKVISNFLPNDDYRKEWKLLFSSTKNGHSFNRFIHHACNSGPTIIVVKEEGGNVFGGFANEPWKPKYPKFYGDEKCFIFKLQPEIEIFRPTGEDVNFQYLNTSSKTLYNGIGMGGVPYLFGWVIDEGFDEGHSKGSKIDEDDPNSLELSSTYGNTHLGTEHDFKVEYVECWQIKEEVIEVDPEEVLDNLNKRKGKSVLNSEGNVDKALRGMIGNHEFTHYHEDNENKKEKILDECR